MRHEPISPQLFIGNRGRLKPLLPPMALAIVNANDVCPTNADGTLAMVPNSDLFYLTGVEQEQTILLLFPDADDEKQREILFLREPSSENQLWEGHKLTKDEARAVTGIKTIHWLSEFPRQLHRLMCEAQSVFLNSNEHKRAVVEVQTREARFIADTMRQYPLHRYERLAPLLHRLRAVKSGIEIDLLRTACDITGKAFARVARFTKPGISESDIEAEFAHEFIRGRARFSYLPIIASGRNACCLHYIANDQECRDGDMLLLDVAACYANYNADLTRTIPVNGKFTRRQRAVYDAVLRVLRQSIANLQPGKHIKEWQKEGEQLLEKELVDLGLLTLREVKRQNPDSPALKKYFMHGLGHPLGLDVHDVGITTEPMQEGWVMTVEPGIYIPEENLAVRLENDVVVTRNGPVDLMAEIPVEADEIEALMARGSRASRTARRRR
ncbi:MAG TPA: aminopeptidase P family protein [Verrucomicrobiae bacterium]|nr:aminopeptidase P family protein [Verrucomicrobiae bacterium]